MILVTCAIITNSDAKVLATQRSERMSLPLKWEFPGGKMEKGESHQDTVLREVREELNIEIAIKAQLTEVVHHYPEFSITLFPFICEHTGGQICLSEHRQYLWLSSDNLLDLDWAAADIPAYLRTLKKCE